jgi:putative membrane protein
MLRMAAGSGMLRIVSIICLAMFVWSALSPHDYFTWFLEVVPALIVFAVMAVTRARFPLTQLLYALVGLHACVLMVGGHYTYAEVPLFDWIAQVMGSARNNYDKVGHFMQGFVPAIAVREILLRRSPLRRGKWLTFIVVSICLAVSAFYELIEWWVAALTGDSAEAFLGTQGYAWDTQSDMLMALIGASTALALLSRLHDRQLANLGD